MTAFLLNLATSTWFPEPWCDEVMYSDPAIRFVLGKGFTSTAWPSQSSSEFWAGNSPLHQLLLIPWLKVFGISPTAVRAFNYFVGSWAVVLLWLAVRRAGWIVGDGWRLLLVALLVSAFSMSFLFRNGRPDAITLLIAAALACELAGGWTSFRRWYVLALGAAIPWSGLQLGVYVGALLCFAWLLARGCVWRFGAWVVGGMALGLTLLFGMYAANGVAVRFVENTIASGHTISGELAQLAVKHDAQAVNRATRRFQAYLHVYHVWLVDRSHPWVMGSLLVCAVWAWKQRLLQWRSPLGFGLAAGLGVPVVVLLAGKYPIYYAWMGFVIVSACAVAALSGYWARFGIVLRVLTLGLLIAAAGVGVPKLFLVAYGGARVDAAAISRFVAQNVSPSDHAFVDGAAYYAAMGRAAETYYSGYGGGRGLRELPAHQRAGVTVLVIDPASLGQCVGKLGDGWVGGDALEVPRSPFGRPVKLTIYRRVADTQRRARAG